MIQVFSQLFPEIKFKNEIPNPLAIKIKANLKYTDILNYFSELSAK
jgi:hypothetical protein